MNTTFGKKIAASGKDKILSKGDLAKMLNTPISVIGRHEKNEMKSSIELAQKTSWFINTTVGLLPWEPEDAHLFKNPGMMQRLKEPHFLSKNDTDNILYALDALLQKIKAKKAYSL